MAKFCNKCGKPLVDGKCSHCEQTEKEVVESTSEENLFIEYLNVLKGMFTHPVATIKKEAPAKNLPLGIVSIVICAILFGIFIHVLLSNIFSSVGMDLSVISTMMEQLNTQIAATGLSLPSLSNVGIKMAIMFAIASVIMAGLIYLMHAVIFKKKLDFKKIVSMIGIIEVSFSVLLLAATILSFIHYVLGLIILILAIAFLLVHLHQGILVISTTTKTQTIYTIALCVGIAIIAFTLSLVTVLISSILALSLQTTSTSISSGLGL